MKSHRMMMVMITNGSLIWKTSNLLEEVGGLRLFIMVLLPVFHEAKLWSKKNSMHCIDFCAWFDDTFPIARQRLYYKYLWIIVKKYAHEERYLEDVRMMIIWDKLAENSLGHGYEIYQHAHSMGSLTRCASLYIRWAEDLELRGAMEDARSIFRKALSFGALPLEDLHAAEDSMEMREMRREIERNNISDEEDDIDDNGQRVAFTRITRDMPEAPVVRLPSIVGEQGSNKLDRGNYAKTNNQKKINTVIEVFEDDAPIQEENYLESLYDMHMDNHIERLILTEHVGEKINQNTACIKKHRNNGPAFTVWSDDKENINPENGALPKPKPKLLLHKFLVSEFSIEEHMAKLWTEQKEEKVRAGVRKLTFDDDSD
ncbi:unnamed protein product [Auanema sp. JU1783]|nr:unnamed protein product [Auanema sp. JU1783]